MAFFGILLRVGMLLASASNRRGKLARHLKVPAGDCDADETARRILSYLAEHPDAQDTAEGIAEWWILERRIKEESTLVQRALNLLVERELLVMETGRDSRSRYHVDQEKYQKIRKFLNSSRAESC